MSKEHGGMGFQHLSAFNLALFGKQTWCLKSQPDLLVSRLYKARYFPHGNILNVHKGSNGSFVRNSIIERLGLS